MSIDNQTEKELIAAGKTAARVTPVAIGKLLKRVIYITVVPKGTTSTFVHAYLDGKFFLASGYSACASPENFDASIGFRIAKEDAMNKATSMLWTLEGYALFKELNHA